MQDVHHDLDCLGSAHVESVACDGTSIAAEYWVLRISEG
jgi:hypothetical protein